MCVGGGENTQTSEGFKETSEGLNLKGMGTDWSKAKRLLLNESSFNLNGSSFNLSDGGPRMKLLPPGTRVRLPEESSWISQTRGNGGGGNSAEDGEAGGG